MAKPRVDGYPRSFGGSFANPDGGIPSIVFDRELKCQFQEKTFIQQIESLSVSLTEPGKLLTLRNPADNAEIPVEVFIAKIQAQGGVTHEDVHLFTYSLYQQVEDEALAAQSVEG